MLSVWRRRAGSQGPRRLQKDTDCFECGGVRARSSRSRVRPFSASSSSRHNQNHYAVLGLNVRASSDEIKKRFYELSKKYHPDANKAADPAKYQQITAAYTVLSNDEKRRQFDTTLGDAVRKPQGYTGERRSWQGTKRAASGYQFHPKPAAQPSHRSRQSATLDPLRVNHTQSRVPHFDAAKHFATQQRFEADRRSRARAARNHDNREDTPHHTPPQGSKGMAVFLATAIAGTSLFFLAAR